MYWPLHCEPEDFFRFIEHGLRFLMNRTGFTEVVITNNGPKWATCGQALIHALSNSRLERYTLLQRTVNRVFAFLEDRGPTRDNRINYVVVAGKRAG